MLQSRSYKEAMEELGRAREAAKRKLSHLTTEARDRWQEIESRLTALEQKLEQGTEKSAENALARVRELTQTVADFLERYAPGGSLSDVPVRKVMTEAPLTCSPEDSLTRPARIMWEADCGAVPVIAEDRTLRGMITDRDVCIAAYTQGQSLSATKVASAMSRDVYTCSADDSLEGVLELMAKMKVRRVPVVADEQRLVGIVALADIARYVRSLGTVGLKASMALAKTLAEVSESSRPERIQKASA